MNLACLVHQAMPRDPFAVMQMSNLACCVIQVIHMNINSTCEHGHL